MTDKPQNPHSYLKSPENDPTTGTLKFGVTFASVDYLINVYYPEPTTGQYGFVFTRQVTDSAGQASTVTVVELAL